MSADRSADAATAARSSGARAGSPATPHLLVACDYDGTLAPIVDDPTTPPAARGDRRAARAGRLPDTTVAVGVRPRAARPRRALAGCPTEVHLVGSHGSEFDVGFVARARRRAARAARPRRDELARDRRRRRARRDARGEAGRRRRPRTAGPTATRRRAALAAVAHGPARLARRPRHARARRSSSSSVVKTDKGDALDPLRHQVGATRRALRRRRRHRRARVRASCTGPDVGVKVGDGDTLAALPRRRARAEVALLLALLAEVRRAWLAGADATPIERPLAALRRRTDRADRRPTPRVTWLCHPDPDSPAMFAELLGGPTAGYFAVRPAHERAPARPALRRPTR